ncbi:M48 family metallopeptidase [Candidatus Kaiserbacteria bacterium]|nr:M48 family metallopeptidase [Candidatus Kaiserbacteria bacterium]
MWTFRRKRTRRRTRRSAGRQPTKHYLAHKETARAFVHERLALHNAEYSFSYKRVFIKNQKSCWGSCSEKGNLNFNYKLLFLPPHIADYVIIHELCHLAELNHSPKFWSLVAQACPEYKACRKVLKTTTMRGVSYAYGSTTARTTARTA